MPSDAHRPVTSLIATAGILLAACLLAVIGTIPLTAASGLLLGVFVLHVPELSRSIRLYLTPLGKPLTRLHPRHRSVFDEIYWSTRNVPLLLLLACTHGTLWSFSGIGVATQLPATVCVAIGLVAAVVFNACVSWFSSRSPGTVQTTDVKRAIATLRTRLPRGKIAQLVSVFKCVYSSPLFEELVYRGFFVFYLAQVTSNVSLAVFVGWLLCVVLHLYQGTGRILPVTIFYAVATSLLFSPAGLLGAIGFHSGCNLEYVLRVRDMAERYLLSRRSGVGGHSNATLTYGRKLQVASGLLVLAVLLEWMPFQAQNGGFPNF